MSGTTPRGTLAGGFDMLALIASPGDKIGHEIDALQRTEIGEVSEGFVAGTVGSITMPQKRNPEIAEHLGTLARVIRHNTALLAEGQVHEHERDGRAWKAEWAVTAETCLVAVKRAALADDLVAHLAVHPGPMLAH